MKIEYHLTLHGNKYVYDDIVDALATVRVINGQHAAEVYKSTVAKELAKATTDLHKDEGCVYVHTMATHIETLLRIAERHTNFYAPIYVSRSIALWQAPPRIWDASDMMALFKAINHAITGIGDLAMVPVTGYVNVSLELYAESKKTLDKLKKDTSLTESFIIAEALEEYASKRK